VSTSTSCPMTKTIVSKGRMAQTISVSHRSNADTTPTTCFVSTRTSDQRPEQRAQTSELPTMPIFMDRHHLHGMTPEHVAEAHRKDLEIQDRYGVKYLTYWYDSERCMGFCLVDAPDAATAEQVHREAHGQIPSEIIGVDLAT